MKRKEYGNRCEDIIYKGPDAQKAYQVLAERPKYKIEKGIRKTVNWGGRMSGG